MTAPRRRWSFSLRTLFVVVTLVAGIAALLTYSTWNRREMLRVTLEWSRLAPLPATAQNFDITTKGGPFTRAFRASFSAPVADIDKWLQDSPGTRDISPERPSATTRKYIISPGGGAMHAEVNVDDSSGAVGIYTFWS